MAASNFELVAPRPSTEKPQFTVADLRRAISKHCFERSLWKSSKYLLLDLVVVALLALASSFIDRLPVPSVIRAVLWAVYWFFQGAVCTGVWVIAHECGHQAFSSSKLINDTVGFILHSCLLVPYFSWHGSSTQGCHVRPQSRRRSPVVRASAAGALSSAARQLLAQLATTDATSGASSAAAAVAEQQQQQQLQLEPHFGSRLAAQLLERAEQAVQQQVPSVQLPLVSNSPLPAQLPAVQLPQFPTSVQLPSVQVPQLPSVQLPDLQFPQGTNVLEGLTSSLSSSTAAAAGTVDALAQLPAHTQQQLQLLLAQLQELNSTNSNLDPHFGTQALLAWLQSAAEALAAALQSAAGSLSLPDVAALSSRGIDVSAGPAVLGSMGSSILGNVTNTISTQGFAGVGATAKANMEALSASLQVLSASAAASLPTDVSEGLTQGADAVRQRASALAGSVQQLQELLLQLSSTLQHLPETGAGGYSFATLCLVSAGALAAVAASVPAADAVAGGREYGGVRDALTHDYDPAAVAAYFQRRPVLVAQRSLQLAVEVAGFGLNLLGDLATGRLQANEHGRAVQLRGVIERLGPAYVKVAQALSTRVDLLSPEYFAQIQMLQDRVPPFPCDQAKEAMAVAFGRPADEVFSYISPRPVAAASLGQVYRAQLRSQYGGGEVAVKVQRPDVLEQVCLDLYLMRQVADSISAMPDVSTDWSALIDSWAVRFLHEMDYTREAANGQLFRQQMADAGVAGVVTADVVLELSNDTVLTTAWVDGEKLSESRAADVRELCNTLLSAYLIQLLDTGLLHADPHPGNLIRTEDGKICVLDFGLMTEVTPTQRIALFEYIAHLTIQDWEKVAYDLQNLGFIPPEVGDDVLQEMAAPLGRILSQLSGGGGATKLNIDAVMAELETLGKVYPFSIPAFFALILRAFSVIEGIALTVDPDYSIVQECFPYLARRLLSDDDPRVRQALRDVLYGGKTRLDVDRLIRLSDAFSAYTTDGLADMQQPQAAAPVRAVTAATPSAPAATPVPAFAMTAPAGSSSSSSTLSPAAKDALLAVFSRKGSYVQELLVEELVAAVDALSREALSDTLRLVLGSAPVALAMSSLEAAGPLRPLLLPFTGPLELMARLAPAVALTPEDEEALGVVRGIFQLVQRMQPAAAVAAAGDRSSGSSSYSSNPAAGMVFSTTGGGGGSRPSLSGMFQPAVLDGRSATAAAVEAVSGAASVAEELRPLLPELLPGLQHTGELFVRTFVRRVAQRASESMALPGGMMTAEQQEEAIAMAALNFLPNRQQGAAQGQLQNPWAFSSSANQFGRQQQQAPGAGGVPGSGLGMSAWGSSSSYAWQPRTAGQLITGLAAAPLLALLTPLAVLSELQRRQQQAQSDRQDRSV